MNERPTADPWDTQPAADPWETQPTSQRLPPLPAKDAPAADGVRPRSRRSVFP